MEQGSFLNKDELDAMIDPDLHLNNPLAYVIRELSKCGDKESSVKVATVAAEAVLATHVRLTGEAQDPRYSIIGKELTRCQNSNGNIEMININRAVIEIAVKTIADDLQPKS
jgi:hypothetical protein